MTKKNNNRSKKNQRRPRRNNGNKRKGKNQSKKNWRVKDVRLTNPPNNTPRLTIQTNRFNGWPDVLYQECTYFQNNFKFDLGSPDIIISTDVNLNNPHDPYAPLGGKSAMFFFQTMAMYRFARVMEAFVSVEYTDNPATNTTPVQMALVMNSEGVAYSTMDDIISLPLSKRVIGKRFTNRIGQSIKLEGTFSPALSVLMTEEQWRLMPTNSDYDVTNIGGIANPVTQCVLSIYTARVDTTTTGTAISIPGTVTINYKIKFYDRQSFPELLPEHLEKKKKKCKCIHSE